MNSRRWDLVATGLVVLGVTIALALWRPWSSPPPEVPVEDLAGNPDVASLFDPTRVVTFTAVNRSGGPVKVTLQGTFPGGNSTLSMEMSDEQSRSSLKVTGPFTVESITVERGGTSRLQEVKATVPAGESREIRVNGDGSVELAAASP
jgi:hypothetical protein